MGTWDAGRSPSKRDIHYRVSDLFSVIVRGGGGAACDAAGAATKKVERANLMAHTSRSAFPLPLTRPPSFALSVCAARHADVRVNIFSPKSSVRPSVRPSDMYTFFEVSEAAAIEIVGKREKRRRFSSDR